MSTILNSQGRYVGLADRPWTKLRVGFRLALDHTASFSHYRFLVGMATNNFSLMYPFGRNGITVLDGTHKFYGFDYGYPATAWNYVGAGGYFIVTNIGAIVLSFGGLYSGLNTPVTESRATVATGYVSSVVGNPAMQIVQFYKNGSTLDIYYWSSTPSATRERTTLWEQIQIPTPSGVLFGAQGAYSLAYGGETLTSLVFNWIGAYNMTMEDLIVYRYE